MVAPAPVDAGEDDEKFLPEKKNATLQLSETAITLVCLASLLILICLFFVIRSKRTSVVLS